MPTTSSPAGQDRRAPDLLTPARWRLRLRRILLVADGTVIAISSLLAYLIRQQLGETGFAAPFANEVPVALAVLPLWLAILYLAGCYRPEYQNQSGESFLRFLSATAVATLVLGFVSFAFRLELARTYVAVLAVLVLVLGTGVRRALRVYLRRQRRRGRLVQKVLIIGTDDEARQVADAILAAPHHGYEVAGFLDDDAPTGTGVMDGLEVVGETAHVLDLAWELGCGLVLVSPTAVPPGTLRDITIALEGSPIDLAVAPSLFEVVTRRVTIESVGNVPILHVDQIRLDRGRAALKRTLDILGGSVLAVVLAPIMLVAAAAIAASDGTPILYRQERVGKDGATFTMLKFRTMDPGADERLDDVAALNEVGHRFFKVRDDPRVTPVGRFLRKWSIDETPQLWNVIRGDMSLVGPRPPLPREVEQYEPWHERRLRVRPGITGVWQVSGRSNIPFDEAVRMDLFYIENWSLTYDLFLLAKTVRAVLGGEGAW